MLTFDTNIHRKIVTLITHFHLSNIILLVLLTALVLVEAVLV